MDRLDARLNALPSAVCHELTGKIAGIDEFKGWWEGRSRAYPSVLRALRARTVPAAAEASARIAAAGFFPPAASPWERGGPRGAPARSRGNPGYGDALRAVLEGRLATEFGQDLVLALHSELLEGLPGERGRAGRYRTTADRPSRYLRGGMEALALRPAEPHMIPAAMERLTGWTASRLRAGPFHPLLVIAAFLLEFLAVRPFARGNAEASRLLATALLLQCGYGHAAYYPLDGIVAERLPEYLAALRRAQAMRNFPRPEIAPWLRAFLDVLAVQAAELRALLAERPREDLLSKNQRAALALFDRHGEVTVRAAVRELCIPRDTARQVLGRLLDRNLVTREGAGRASRYVRLPSPR